MIKSYCKINLSLRVLKKKKNSLLHDIQSNNILLNLHDKISIKKNNQKKDKVIFKGEFKELVEKRNNTIIKTLNKLREKNFIKKHIFYNVIVLKKIPIFSGLGGGTSNAAYIMKNFIKTKINNSILNSFEKVVGSDLRIFFFNQSFQRSLKKLTKYKKSFTFNFLIIFPHIKCSTKDIYAKVKNYSQKSKLNYSNILSQKQFMYSIMKDKNDLEPVVFSKFKNLKNIINLLLKEKGCYFARMTGSGSACFGMFKSQKLAKLASANIYKKFPKYWFKVTKTI